MKYLMQIIRLYFQLLSLLSPIWAGRKATVLFQKTIRKPIRKREKALYEQGRSFTVFHEEENIEAYELGNPDGKLVFLVHGWNGNAGNMTAIAGALATQGYRVISFDLPAHGKSRLTHTNLRKMSLAFHSVISQVNPTEAFSVVAHSFGSAVSIFTLTNGQYEIDKLVILTSPDKFEPIFMEFARAIGLNKKAYRVMVDGISAIVRQAADKMRLSEIVSQIPKQELIMIHDRTDRVLSFKNTEAFMVANPDARLVTLEGVGHYRMLWDEDVLQVLGDTFAQRVKSFQS